MLPDSPLADVPLLVHNEYKEYKMNIKKKICSEENGWHTEE